VKGQITGLEREMNTRLKAMDKKIDQLSEKIDYKHETMGMKIANIHSSVESFFHQTKSEFYKALLTERGEIIPPALPENQTKQ
jgi:ABC-type Fe3+-citrate transport system substrate-binding protein